MSFAKLNELNVQATTLLREAMTNERSKKWKKVIGIYHQLLNMISKDNFPLNYEPPDGYGMLLYEIYYHLGWAQQHLSDHQSSLKSYQNAIDAVFIPKNGCLAGCQSKSCLMTPLHTRRAFAYSKLGDFKNAMREAEKAVVLDPRNPDAFCVRALVQNTFVYKKQAIKDLNKALSLNSSHMCALLLRGTLDKPMMAHESVPGWKKEAPNKDHIKAFLINPDCHVYVNVTSFHAQNVVQFYDRFLYSLNVPHNVTAVNMHPNGASKIDQQSADNQSLKQENNTANSHRKPFRCGTPIEQSERVTTRRLQYGESIRKHNDRPKTAEDYLALIKKQQMERHKQEVLLSRPATTVNVNQSEHTTSTLANAKQSKTGRPLQTTETKVFPVHRTKRKEYCAVPVFQSISFDAPRVYYRPWIGDVVPSPDVQRYQFNPAFY